MIRPSTDNVPGPAAVRATSSELRWLADSYEQAQRVRIQSGERIRALLQARDSGAIDSAAFPPAEELLREIRAGTTDGPVPLLGRTHRRHWEAEREYAAAMKEALANHPAWPWLEQVRGIGATLAAKLLARLDIHRADTPSAFWAYCGLATIPGVEYRCAVCGYTASHPESHKVSGAHVRLGSTRPCEGRLVRVRGTEDGVRVAQPRPHRGERPAYDQYAKKVCYLVGTSFLKSGGPYRDFYQREKKKLEADRPGWTASRRHLAALRKAEKLFLSHLWLVWREAVGLPLTEPYSGAVQGQEVSGAWELIGARKPDAAQPSSTVPPSTQPPSAEPPHRPSRDPRAKPPSLPPRRARPLGTRSPRAGT